MKRTAKINLLHRDAPNSQQQTGSSPAAMTLGQLQRNYQAILQTRAIYYPVAYQFLRKLGAGRQGEVFLGLRQGARGCITEHAIKVFDPGIYRSPEEYWSDMGRIASQISQLQRLQSPNIVTRHTYEETYGIGYVQMEAVDGIDLRSFLSREHLDIAMKRSTASEMAEFTRHMFRLDGNRICMRPGLTLYILRGVLRGLERLHAMNFLHSDVKPANIMFDRLGFVKLIDFGRAVTAGEELSFLFGSPLYMSIETHEQKPGGPDSDLFSVGLVALEMLRGRPLLDDPEASLETLLAVKRGLATTLDSLLPTEVLDSADIVSMIRKLLHADPADRYSDAKEADAGTEGLGKIDKRLVQEGQDTDYERVLSDYLSKLVDPQTNRIEIPQSQSPTSSLALMRDARAVPRGAPYA
ncbi:MAG: serine/threonine protein kinase [Lentisphaerae bacterium]|nr:serine/threonine protein kinase [Lentisphaerota bacterium]